MTTTKKFSLYMPAELDQLSFTPKPGWQKVRHDDVGRLELAIALFLYDDEPLADMLGLCFCSMANDYVFGSWREAVPYPSGGWATYFIDLSSYYEDYCRTPGIYTFDLRERSRPMGSEPSQEL